MSDKKILNVKMPNIIDSYYEDEDFQQELDKISIDNICASEQTRVIKNIRKTLASTLKKKYGFSNGELKELTTQILKIHGLDESNFDSLSMFDSFISERINDLSIDDNSNKNEKTIAGTMNEVNASNQKLIGYHMLYQTMKELYGQEEAKRLSGDMYDLSLGLSDSTKICLPYCWALDASKLVVEGRKFGQLPSAPSHRVDSYVSALDETLHQMSSHLAGAIAVGTFFLDIAHVLMYKMRIPFSKVKENISFRKYIENCYQTFIHSVNHLSRNGVESPFTNISLFDREKLKYLIGNDNYGWYFPNKLAVAQDNGFDNKMSAEEWSNFIVEYVIELQRIYANFHNMGDPLNNGLPYRFPVVTYNFSKSDNKDIEDEEFLKEACKLDISRFNIFTSQGTKVASCCFDENIKVTIKLPNEDEKEILLKDYVNQNVEIKGKDNRYHNGKIIKTIRETPMYKIIFTNNEEIITTASHIHVLNDNTEKVTTELNRGDILLSINNEYIVQEVFEISDYNKNEVYCVEMEDKTNPYFQLANGIITHNCRLINDSELLDMGSTVNSFGGSTISMGSHRVCTVNFARIAYEAKDMKDFYKILDKRTKEAGKILKAHKVLIGKLTQVGLEPFISRGWIRMDRLFSTYGILGVVEAQKILKTKFPEYHTEEHNLMVEFLKHFDAKVRETGKELGIATNIEQIPGESFAVRLATADKLIFPDMNIIDAPLYSNQFVPLWEDSTVWERMSEYGVADACLSGGGIVHLQIGSATTPKQNEKIIREAIKCDCEHFSLNRVYSRCKDCGHVYDTKMKDCPHCGKNNMEYFTRTIGYFTPVDSWNKVRREWEFPRRKFNDDSLMQ